MCHQYWVARSVDPVGAYTGPSSICTAVPPDRHATTRPDRLGESWTLTHPVSPMPSRTIPGAPTAGNAADTPQRPSNVCQPPPLAIRYRLHDVSWLLAPAVAM